jgi:1-deoxy-D-xylulose-5-phosphate synthase
MKRTLPEYDFPADLKKMNLDELELLSYEIRDFLLEKVSKTGGHLAANLGVVELSIALHKFYNSPSDHIIWDVGHQSYIHKILTGRACRFDTLRQMNGLSGFPKCEESPHDIFETGHASTSVAAAFGLATARDLKGETHKVIAVIGDGALTSGLAYEGFNNAGGKDTDLTVILNDNNMSISRNVGGMSQHLSKLRTSQGYLEFKKHLKNTLTHIPAVGEGLYSGLESIKDSIKYAVINDAAIFEALGFKYLGPIDGHRIGDLLEAFEIAEQIEGPKLIHVLTQKGKGYKNAELDPNKFHGIAPFERETGKVLTSVSHPSYSHIFGETLQQMADKDSRIVAVYAAMLEGTGLQGFQKAYPKRTFDVGIAEGGAVTYAAGLAKGGLRPFVAIYSTFLQRSYDMIMMDVCMQNLPVVFCLDRAGIVGNDGETHHGIFDLSYLSHMPNLTIMSPRNGQELQSMLAYSLTLPGPCAIRYPRGESTISSTMDEQGNEWGISILKKGNDIGLYGVGIMAEIAYEVGLQLEEKGISAQVVDPRFVKPLREEELLETVHYNKIVTIEDNVVSGGFGQGFQLLLSQHIKTPPEMLILGWPVQFIEQGSQKELYEKYGLDEKGILERVERFVKG